MNRIKSFENQLIELSIFILSILFYLILAKYSSFTCSTLIFYFFKLLVYPFIMKKAFNLHSLNAMNKLFIGDNSYDKTDMRLALFVSNFDALKLKELFFNKIIKPNFKFRSKLIYRFYDYFLVEESNEKELKARIKVIKDGNIKNDEDVKNYIKNGINNILDPFKSTIEILIFEYGHNNINNKDNKGAVYIVVDHLISDGINISKLLFLASDNYDLESFPIAFRKDIPLFKTIYDFLTIPFYFYQIFGIIKYKSTFKETAQKQAPSGKTIIEISKSFPFEKLSLKQKELKISFNDLILSILSKAFKEYFKSKSNKTIQGLNIMIAVGVKMNLNQGFDEFDTNVRASGIMINIPAVDSIEDEAYIINKRSKIYLNNTVFPLIKANFPNLLFINIPRFILKFLAINFVRDIDFIVTNVPGTKKLVELNGNIVNEIIPLINTAFNYIKIPVTTYNNTVRFAVCVDKVTGIDPCKLVFFIEQQIQRLIN